MNTKKLLLPLAALMVACTPLAGADIPDTDGVCDGAEPANIECEVIAGPASLTVKGVLSVGIGFCQTETTDIPLQCAGGAGNINGAGAATFGGAIGTGPQLISINAVLDTGSTCTATTSPPCGFTVDICNDRDQDSTCTNIGDQDDELYDAVSGEDLTGACDKDPKKNCANPNEAGREECMDDSVFSDWGADQIIVFIGALVGATPDNADGAKVSAGTYTIWFEDNGDCTQTTNPNPSSGCIWARTPADSPTPTVPTTETCADGGGNAISFDCNGGADQRLVVFHISAGGDTRAIANSCSGQNPQVANVPPVNAQTESPTPGSFQCQFTWVGAGAGGCIIV